MNCLPQLLLDQNYQIQFKSYFKHKMEDKLGITNNERNISLYKGWQAPIGLLATYYTAFAILILALVACELLYRCKLTRKSKEQQAMFAQNTIGALELRQSGRDKPDASLFRSQRVGSGTGTLLSNDSDPMIVMQNQNANRERLLIQGGAKGHFAPGASASDQLLQNPQFQLLYPQANSGTDSASSQKLRNNNAQQLSHAMLEDGAVAGTIFNGVSTEQSVLNTGDTQRAIQARREQHDGRNPSENNIAVIRQLNSGQSSSQHQGHIYYNARPSMTEVDSIRTDSQLKPATSGSDHTNHFMPVPSSTVAERRNTGQQLRVVQQKQHQNQQLNMKEGRISSPFSQHRRRRSTSFNIDDDEKRSTSSIYAPNRNNTNLSSNISQNYSANKGKNSRLSDEGFQLKKSMTDLPGVQLLRSLNNRNSGTASLVSTQIQPNVMNNNNNDQSKSILSKEASLNGDP